MKDEPKITFDAALLMALHADAKQEISELPTPKELKECYPDTKRWDIRLKNTLNRRKSIVWKRLLVSTAACCMLFVSALAVSADFRNAVYSTIMEFRKIEVEIFYRGTGDILKELPDGYGEHYIIDGYKLDESQSIDLEGGFIHLYQKQNENDSTKFYTVECFVISYASSIVMDSEHTIYTSIMINDTEVLCGKSVTENEEEVYYLVWEKDGISHMVNGRADLAELILVAEAIY